MFENHATPGDHARPPHGSVVCSKYKVVRESGSGNFARVLECTNVTSSSPVAVKLLKRGYERDADFEADVLLALNKKDPSDQYPVVKMIDRIVWNGHAGIVFNLKGKSLRSSRLPLPRHEIACIAKDVSSALHFLHDVARVVHTDLKPENILQEIDSRRASKWTVCDFGSSSFYSTQLDHDLITTRPYRAPEVVMNRGWSYQADTWSLGCILFELKTGRKLFDARNDPEHLECMFARLGPPPRQMTFSRRFASRILSLEQELRDDPELLSLLRLLLAYDPQDRLKCRDVASHPFVVNEMKTQPGLPKAADEVHAAAPHAAISPSVPSLIPPPGMAAAPSYLRSSSASSTGSAASSAGVSHSAATSPVVPATLIRPSIMSPSIASFPTSLRWGFGRAA